jgi:23S rRNA (uracil1939-C5)-methyltransferase
MLVTSVVAGKYRTVNEIEWDPEAEVRCTHVRECGACPLMPKRYEDQRADKLERLTRALDRYQIGAVADGMARAEAITAYRRRAKLVVSRDAAGGVALGLYRRNDNQTVIDIPGCQVLSGTLMELCAELRTLCKAPPPELAALLVPVGPDGKGVLTGIDARELCVPGDAQGVLLTVILAAERAAPADELREAARALRQRFPRIAGVAASLRFASRREGSSELVQLSGASELRDALDAPGDSDAGYQLVSHSSFLHVHRGQAGRLYKLIVRLVNDATGGKPGKILDLYGGTGAIALALARAGHSATLVESYPPAAALATRAAQAQRLPVEVVTGDVASVTKALSSIAATDATRLMATFDVVVANPPRRGLSPAAREAIAALGPKCVVYVACDLDNLSRDLDHLERLGYRARELFPMDMLPLTEEIEVVAVLEPAPAPEPVVLHREPGIVALDKPPHEPVQDQPEYPVSLVARAKRTIDGGDWYTVLKIEPGTSGVCLYAKDAPTAEKWSAALERSGRLVYIAAARGVTPAKGAISRELRGEDGARMARTRYRRLAIGGGHSVLRVVPEQRALHQIRRHLAAVGHPVLGDMRYGHAPTNRYFEEKHGLDRSFLHLVRVEMDHPDSGERLLIEAPLPPDLRAALLRASDDSVLEFLENKRALGAAGSQLVPKGAEPPSERMSITGVEPSPDSIAASYRGPVSIRGSSSPIDLDEAPRTVRGELLSHEEEDA